MSGLLFRACALRTSLEAQLIVAPRTPRTKLLLNTSVIGSVEPDFLRALEGNAFLHSKQVHIVSSQEFHANWQMQGHAQSVLTHLASVLRDMGLSGAWRNERAHVYDAQGELVGAIERGVVRVLGINTQSVGLMGWTADQRIWVQQRAATKSDNPMLWDILSNGMVTDADDVRSALARETWEEAGLDVKVLSHVQYAGQFAYARPSKAGNGAGYLRETMNWFSAIVEEHFHPKNQDGEVAQFACLTPDEILNAIEMQSFTLDAAYVLVSEIVKMLEKKGIEPDALCDFIPHSYQ